MKPEIKERIEKIRKGEVPEGYKKTKVGIIPDDWKIITFEDIADKKVKWSITGGPFGSNLKASEYTSDGVRIIQLQNIGDGIFNDNYKIYTSKEKANELLSCNIYPNEIILSKMGNPVARACFVPNKGMRFLMSSDGIRLVVDESRFSKKFIHDYINSTYFRKRALDASIGSTRLRIGLHDLKKLLIIAPPLPEQKKIANILSTWDKAIELKEKLIEEKKESKRGLMQKLLTGKTRFPEFIDEWVEIDLNKIVEKINNKNHEKNQTIVTISAKKGFVNQNEYFNKIVASQDLSNYYLIHKGDFAYNKSYSNGYPVGVIKRLESFEKAVVTTLYICFRIKDKTVSSDFLKYYFDSELLNRQIKRIANEGGRAHGLLNVTPNDFFNIDVNLPEYEEQEKVSNILLANDQDIQLLEKELFELKKQKRGLMQLLLTGAVRVEVN